MRRNDQTVTALFIWAIIIFLFWYRFGRKRPQSTAFGSAAWATEKKLRAAGMLSGDGLIIGRTSGGSLIRSPKWACHTLLVGGTGAGKGVGIIIPNLLKWFRGSMVVFDTKSDLFQTTAAHRAARGQRIIRLAPFSKEATDTLNPLDAIPAGPLLVDSARALAESLVVRTGMEPDPHWNDKAVQIITALLVLVLLRFEGEERSLNTVDEIASDPEMVAVAADQLRKMGGIPARLGSQLKTLFEKAGEGILSKEGAGCQSTVSRHLNFLGSDLVMRSVATSTFNPRQLKLPGTTVYLQIPPEQLEAQKGLLRCWITTLDRAIGSEQGGGEVLFLLDEAFSTGVASLPAIEQALVLGRSSGVRLLLAGQSDAQVQAAIKDKPTIFYDNSNAQLYLGASSIENASRLSKMLGQYTQTVQSYGTNRSRSHTESGQPSQQYGGGNSENYSESAHSLMLPEEILTMEDDKLFAFVRNMPPILAQRIKWYDDPEFNGKPGRRAVKRIPLFWKLVAAYLVGMFLLWWVKH